MGCGFVVLWLEKFDECESTDEQDDKDNAEEVEVFVDEGNRFGADGPEDDGNTVEADGTSDEAGDKEDEEVHLCGAGGEGEEFEWDWRECRDEDEPLAVGVEGVA